MISNKPYIVRAMYEWIVDNEWTPHVQVDANYPGVKVPVAFVQEGVIVLNLDPSAIIALSMDNNWFSFKARFGGIETQVGFAPEAILAIFAQENGQGMPFPAEPYPSEEARPSETEAAKSKPKLTALKTETSAHLETEKPPLTGKKPTSSSKKKPSLSIVK